MLAVLKAIFTLQTVLAIVRHAATFVGGLLLTKGLLDPAGSDILVGTAVAIAGLVWSIVDKALRANPA